MNCRSCLHKHQCKSARDRQCQPAIKLILRSAVCMTYTTCGGKCHHIRHTSNSTHIDFTQIKFSTACIRRYQQSTLTRLEVTHTRHSSSSAHTVQLGFEQDSAKHTEDRQLLGRPLKSTLTTQPPGQCVTHTYAHAHAPTPNAHPCPVSRLLREHTFSHSPHSSLLGSDAWLDSRTSKSERRGITRQPNISIREPRNDHSESRGFARHS